MKLISHRGNITGKFDEYENHPTYIDEAIDFGYEVEIDLWMKEGVLFLGHDLPEYAIPHKWIQERSDKLWIHSKNLHASEWLNTTELNWFWHENDKMVLTSKGVIWSNIGVYVKNGIVVELEFKELPDYILGVCSDYISHYGTRST